MASFDVRVSNVIDSIKTKLADAGVDVNAVLNSKRNLDASVKTNEFDSESSEKMAAISDPTTLAAAVEGYVLSRFDLTVQSVQKSFLDTVESPKLEDYEKMFAWIQSIYAAFAAHVLSHNEQAYSALILKLHARELSIVADTTRRLMERSANGPTEVLPPNVPDDDFSISGRVGTLIREAGNEDPIDDFRSFSYEERQYLLTKGEVGRVQILWGRYKKRNPKVFKSGLRLGAQEFKPAKVFTSDDGKRFRTDFIHHDDSGRYWLEVP